VFQEESFRIPLFMRLPGKLRPRQDTLHINVPDMFPTLLGLLDLDDHVPAKVAGTNHAQLILTERGTRPTSTFFIGAAGVSPDRGVRAIRTDRHTFVVARQGLVQPLLYDRQTDPYQQTNIADRHPELCQQLLAELNAWLKRTDDPWPQQEWPLRSSGSFAIHREGNVVRLDFEPPGNAKEVIAPDGSEGRIVTEDAIAGTRSLLADSRKTTGRWHEILHVDGIVSPNRTYELSCKYHVVAAPDKAQFYTVVRSPTTQHRAIRDFWREDDGKSGVRTVQFQTEAAKDYQVLFGVENQGAVIWDDVVLRDLGPVKA
jgi:hypothetical protein